MHILNRKLYIYIHIFRGCCFNIDLYIYDHVCILQHAAVSVLPCKTFSTKPAIPWYGPVQIQILCWKTGKLRCIYKFETLEVYQDDTSITWSNLIWPSVSTAIAPNDPASFVWRTWPSGEQISGCTHLCNSNRTDWFSKEGLNILIWYQIKLCLWNFWGMHGKKHLKLKPCIAWSHVFSNRCGKHHCRWSHMKLSHCHTWSELRSIHKKNMWFSTCCRKSPGQHSEPVLQKG